MRRWKRIDRESGKGGRRMEKKEEEGQKRREEGRKTEALSEKMREKKR